MFRLSNITEKNGGFALGFRGDVVGYPASSLGSFTPSSKLADFHTNL